MKKLAIVILAITIIFPSAYLLADDDEAEAKGAKAKQETTAQTQTPPDQTAVPVSPPAVKPDAPKPQPAPPPPSPPPPPTSPIPTLEQLQAQRALLSERIAGAEEAKALLDQLIVAGKVKLQRYDEAIQAAQQSQTPPTKPTKK